METKRLEIVDLLRAGFSIMDVARITNTALSMVYRWKERMDKAVNNSNGYVDVTSRERGHRKRKVSDKVLKRAIKRAPTKSLAVHAKTVGVHKSTVSRAIRRMGGKSLARRHRPYLPPGLKKRRFDRAKMLLNELKCSRFSNRIIFFADEKTFDVDPIRNTKNDRYVKFPSQEAEDDVKYCLLYTSPSPRDRG